MEADRIAPADERRHVPGPGRDWEESWYLDFVAFDGRLGGYVRLTLRPHEGTAWFWAGMVGGGPPLVTVRDHEVPMPSGGGLEVRASGLWTELVCETPLDHWSVGLEAFGVALDDPLEAWGRERGDPWALGLDVEWEGVEACRSWPAGGGPSPTSPAGGGPSPTSPAGGGPSPTSPAGGGPSPTSPAGGGPSPTSPAGGYWQGCTVHGDVLVGAGRFSLDGAGTRMHLWGDPGRSVPGGWAAGRLDDGTVFAVPDPGVGCDPEGRIRSVAMDGVTGTAVAHSPVLLPGAGRLARAMCRYEADGGRSGYGWAEWFLPQA